MRHDGGLNLGNITWDVKRAMAFTYEKLQQWWLFSINNTCPNTIFRIIFFLYISIICWADAIWKKKRRNKYQKISSSLKNLMHFSKRQQMYCDGPTRCCYTLKMQLLKYTLKNVSRAFGFLWDKSIWKGLQVIHGK